MATDEALRHFLDRSAIIEAIQNWGFFRDDGKWDALRDLYTVDGMMSTTWSRGTADAFVAAVRGRIKDGPYRSQHSIGVSTVFIRGDRATAETRMTLLLRGKFRGVEVDIINWGRTYDRFVRQGDRWRIQERVPIYEKDRMDPVEAGRTLALTEADLAAYPYGYRHLACFQAEAGATTNFDLPTPGSPALTRLYEEGSAWLLAS